MNFPIFECIEINPNLVINHCFWSLLRKKFEKVRAVYTDLPIWGPHGDPMGTPWGPHGGILDRPRGHFFGLFRISFRGIWVD